MGLLKVLIVEDQAPLDNLIEAVEEVFPRHYKGFNSENYQTAQCYNDAKRLIEKNRYDFVILDHRMPIENQGDLINRDFDAFCENLRNVGYSLIPLIKERNPKAVVIGTSSLSRDELREYSAPDFTLKKVSSELSRDLEKIVSHSTKAGEAC